MAFLDAFQKNERPLNHSNEEHPEYYAYGGALDWQNSNISSYLGEASEYFTDGPNRFSGTQPSWRDIANFLWFGKIYE